MPLPCGMGAAGHQKRRVPQRLIRRGQNSFAGEGGIITVPTTQVLLQPLFLLWTQFPVVSPHQTDQTRFLRPPDPVAATALNSADSPIESHESGRPQ